MFWPFWQLVGIAVALLWVCLAVFILWGIGAAVTAVFGGPSITTTSSSVIYFERCDSCEERFEANSADEALQLRATHSVRTHGHANKIHGELVSDEENARMERETGGNGVERLENLLPKSPARP
jgi:hypothetical protein